jgi:hypothetical protein
MRALPTAPSCSQSGNDGGLYPDKVRADRAELMKLTSDVIDWADQVIAHSYPREQRPATVTYDDLHRAIDDVTGTYNRYRELLTATSIAFELTAIDPAWSQLSTGPCSPALDSRVLPNRDRPVPGRRLCSTRPGRWFLLGVCGFASGKSDLKDQAHEPNQNHCDEEPDHRSHEVLLYAASGNQPADGCTRYAYEDVGRDQVAVPCEETQLLR